MSAISTSSNLRINRMDLAHPFTDGEVNAHLSERFSGVSFLNDNSVPNDKVPTSGPSRVNNDIREYYELSKKPVTGGAWLDQPEIPSPSEVLRKKPGFSSTEANTLIEIDENIRPHKIEGAYENNEDYLRTKYELLREDAIRPLREAIDEIRADPFKDEAEYSNQSIGIYDPVYITSLVFSPRGLATRVAFSLARVKKRIRWEQSKRLITGTLVALSPTDDAFQTQCVLATVAARPLSALDQTPPEIDLFFARPEDQEIDPMRKWIMVECRDSFFEASRHTLLALQHLMREPFPMSKYLVHAQRNVEPPAYIAHNPYVNLSSLVSMEESADFENVNVLEEWPSASSHSLDKSQSKALKRMLTSELAIVQGPPGTGKTFVSVVGMQIARDNLRKDDAPIIVTAQTNHAVDQLLRHTAQFEPKYIRLGGRSKDKEIKKRTLWEVRSELAQQKQPGSQKVQAIIAMRKLTNACQILLAPLEANKPPLNHKVLLSLKLLTEKQAESLEMDSRYTMGISSTDSPGILMEQWLGKCLAPCTRPILPDDYEWGYEEEDFEVEQLKELEAEAIAQDDDEKETLRGPVTLLCDNYTGRGGSLLTTLDIQVLLQRTDDLTMIPVPDRGAIYNYFMREAKKLILAQVREIAKEYNQTVLQRKVGMWEEDVRILRDARIIGCTTTGLSKYRALLSALRPRICLVEEAAETLEAPVTAACFPSLEHLILVGDHQQLRPHTQVRAFEDEPYYLNLSLFERLVWNDVEFDTLTRQRRMIPEIRRLLYPIYDDTLKDHNSVKDPSNRPAVEGMGGNNTFFFCHEWLESRDANMSSVNLREADMIVGFFDYLVLNGVDPMNITVLTFYNGQRKTILKKLRDHPNLRAYPGTPVVTVDSYQGEENSIVLLSLVRSNRNHAIGFLSSDNRACVALSRAKRGFYMFGNAELLACESGTWGAVIDIMHGDKKVKVKTGQKRRLGYQFPLECSKHARKIWIEEPDDWECIHGGCDMKCDGSLPSMCCDPCKCQICDRRNNGTKSMLKPVFNGTTSFQPPPSATQNLMLNTRSQVRSNPMAAAIAPREFDNSTEQWEAYASGAVQAEDTEVLRKVREQEAQFLQSICNATSSSAGPSSESTKLIEVSPDKVAGSMHTALLLDLEMTADAPPQQGRQSMAGFSYANAASHKGKAKGKADFDLLD
ncbi:Nn.00g106240.m01.CDS01 [Neocucurbitaria sp. VM-36]